MSPRPGSGRKLSSRINHWLNLEINKKLDRDKAAIKYDLVANLKISEGQNRIQISFDANDKFVTPSSIKISFLHPTMKGQDP